MPVERYLLPRQMMTRKAFENAISSREASGGSTIAVYVIACDRQYICGRIDFEISDFETVRRKVPVLCDLKQSGGGKYVADRSA